MERAMDQGAIEKAMDCASDESGIYGMIDGWYKRWMERAIDQGALEGAMDGASNGSRSN